VRFYKRDLQGACDTLLYSDADSLLRMRSRPVLWSGNDQITGDSIRIALRNGHPHRLLVERNAFLLGRADSTRYDQVAGLRMTGWFANDELDRLEVEGNARTAYHASEDKDGTQRIFGLNRADCSRIRVRLREGRIIAVTFLDKPDAVLYPIDQIPEEERTLQGIMDRFAERPSDRSAIHAP
jgi:hypothetical protein